MKSPGIVYRKYRQVKRKLLYYCLTESYKKAHDNCLYGHLIKYDDTDNRHRSAKLCLFGVRDKQNLDARNLDVCTCAMECNAFAPKATKDEVVKNFESDVENEFICSEKYPELAAYLWVLDKDLELAKKNPNVFNMFVIYLINILEKVLKK